jgi:hypothetical protein
VATIESTVSKVWALTEGTPWPKNWLKVQPAKVVSWAWAAMGRRRAAKLLDIRFFTLISFRRI